MNKSNVRMRKKALVNLLNFLLQKKNFEWLT